MLRPRIMFLLLYTTCSSPPPPPAAPPEPPAPAPAPVETKPRVEPQESPQSPPWSPFTAFAIEDTPDGCALSMLRVAPSGVEPLHRVALLPGACGTSINVSVAIDAKRLGIVYGAQPTIAIVEDGVVRLPPPLPERAATVRFAGDEVRAFGVYDDVAVTTVDPPDDVETYVATINGKTWHGGYTGDNAGATPCGEWRLVEGAWVHVTDGLAGSDAGQGDACPAIDPERLYGWELDVEFPYPTRAWDSVERAPVYRGTLHGDGGKVVVTAEWHQTDSDGAEPGGELEVTVAGATASILASIPMTGNALVAFDPPLVCSTQLGGAVISLRGPTAADAVKPIWEGKHCLRRWPDEVAMPVAMLVPAAPTEAAPPEAPVGLATPLDHREAAAPPGP